MSVPAFVLRSRQRQKCSQIVANRIRQEPAKRAFGPERSVPMAAIYKRGKIWWVKFGLSGVRIQQSLNTADKRVALARKHQIQYKLATTGLELPSKTDLDRFLQAYCDYLRNSLTYVSYKRDISYLRGFFGQRCQALKLARRSNKDAKITGKDNKSVSNEHRNGFFKSRLLEEVTSEAVSHFISRRIEMDKISPKTANRYREILHKMFNWAIKEKGYRGPGGNRSNPIAGIQRRKEPAGVIRFLSLEQISEQLKALRGNPTLFAMVATLIYAGLRRAEVTWLTADDVDLENRLLRVRAKMVDEVFWQPKTGTDRVVPISQTLHKILSAYRPKRELTWFFPSPQGCRWDPDNFSAALRKINKEAKLKWSCLDFRHTFGSQLAQKGESLYKIAQLMGNSPEICRRHYAALIPEKMHDSVEFQAAGKPKADRLEELLEQVLERMDKQEKKGHRQEKVRIVQVGNRAV